LLVPCSVLPRYSLMYAPLLPGFLHSFPTRRSSDLVLTEDEWENREDIKHENMKVANRRSVLDFEKWQAKFEKDRKELVENANIIDRKSTRLNSSHVRISYAVFCLKKKFNQDFFP